MRKFILILILLTPFFIQGEEIDYRQTIYARFLLADKEPERTLVEMQKTIKEMENRNLDNKLMAEGYYYLACTYAYNNMANYYMENLSKAIEKDPEYVKAYLDRIYGYIKKKKFDLAKKDIEKVSVLDPKNEKLKKLIDQLQKESLKK